MNTKNLDSFRNMQRAFFTIGLLMCIGSGAFAQALGAWYGSIVSVCDNTDSEIYQFEFYGAVQTNQVAEIRFVKTDQFGTPIGASTFVMNVATTNSYPVSNIYLDVTWTDNAVSVKSNSPNTTSNGTVKPLGNLAEGYYAFEAKIKQGGTPTGTTWTAVLPIFFSKGQKPWNVKINDKSDVFVSVYDGCEGGDVKMKAAECGNSFSLMVREIDPVTGTTLSTADAFRALTPSEVSLLNGSGLSIENWSGGGGNITMSAGGTYFVALTNTSYGGWKSTGRWVQVKAGSWDLVMFDNDLKDNGYEPWDQWSNDLFKSPDIWNKRSTTNFQNDKAHETPDYVTVSGNTNKLMVEVTNIGCAESPADVPLRLFWTRARVGELYDSHWLATTTNMVTSAATQNPYAAGSEITIDNPTMSNPYSLNSDPFLLPAIPAGQTWTMDFSNDGVDWFPPDPQHYDASNGGMAGSINRPEICLLARINETTSTDDPITWEPVLQMPLIPITDYVRNNNNVVTRNTILYDDVTFIANPGNGTWNYGFTTVLVDNTTEENQTLDICLDQVFLDDEQLSFLNYGSIEVGMTEGLFSLWQQGGEETENMSMSEETIFEVFEGHACLNNITLEPGTSEVLGVRFNYSGESFPEYEVPMEFHLNPNYYQDGLNGSANIMELTMPTSSPVGKRGDAGLNESVESTVRIYPNPANQMMNIYYGAGSAEQVDQFDLKVMNVAGQIVMSKTALKTNTQCSINIENLEAGVYLIELKAGSHTTTERLIIK